MSERTSCRFTAVLVALLLGASVVQAAAAQHHGKGAVVSRRSRTAWAKIGLRHVTPLYVLTALRQGREWNVRLHGAEGRLLEGVSYVIPSSRTNTLFVQGTSGGVQQLREIVALLDTPAPPAPVLGLEAGVTRAYQMALLGEWQKSVLAAESARFRSPENAEASALQAYSLVKSGRTREAETLATTALRRTEGTTGRARALALVAAGALSEAHGSKSNAVASYQNAGNADQTCALPYLAFADYAHRNGKSEVAKRLLQSGLAAVKTPEEQAAIRAKLGAY
ncbi:MAG: hypothetical protein M3Y28_03385 [Armatimonadota bacterium]|nr:hypothetical protein [Armatimonadota bacterium]